MSIKSVVIKASKVLATGAVGTVAVFVPGIVADSVSPIPQDTTTSQVVKSALLPDRTVSNFLDAALDGTGQKSKLVETWKGTQQDMFEVFEAPGKLVVVATR